MYVILLALLWLIWLRREGEKQLVFASQFLTRTGIDLSEDSFDLAFGCWGNSPTDIWRTRCRWSIQYLVGRLRQEGSLFQNWYFRKGFSLYFAERLTFCLSFNSASLGDVIGGVCNVLLFPLFDSLVLCVFKSRFSFLLPWQLLYQNTFFYNLFK